jgi:hypothetical protein
MLVLGGAVNGRKFYGSWPGLNPEILSPTFGDVPVTTDYRRVVSEIMIRRMANPNLSTIFPGYAGYAPFGIVQGSDLTPKIEQALAASSFVAPTPGSSVPASSHTIASSPTPEWQRRGAVDRTLTRRER